MFNDDRMRMERSTKDNIPWIRRKYAFPARILTFLLGYGTAFLLGSFPSTPEKSLDFARRNTPYQRTGNLVRWEDIPMRPTSHIDAQQGRPIMKQQLLDPWVVPHLSGISIATFQSQQRVSSHVHSSMDEFFYILHGNGFAQIDDQPITIMKEGTLLHVAAGEHHSLWANPNETLQVLVLGITETPDGKSPSLAQ